MVDDQHVERAHRLVRRPFRVAVVERADGNARPGVDRTCDLLPGIGRAAESVLGREDRRDGKPFAVEQVDQMHPPGGIGSRRARAAPATEVWLASTATRRPRSSG